MVGRYCVGVYGALKVAVKTVAGIDHGCTDFEPQPYPEEVVYHRCCQTFIEDLRWLSDSRLDHE